MQIVTGDSREASVRRLWRMGKDTIDIAYATNMPQPVVERVIHRMLDEQYQASCPAR